MDKFTGTIFNEALEWGIILFSTFKDFPVMFTFTCSIDLLTYVHLDGGLMFCSRGLMRRTEQFIKSLKP